MRYRFPLLCAFGVLLSVVLLSGRGVASASPQPAAPPTPAGVKEVPVTEVRVTEADRERVLALAAGEELVVTLPVNPSTGQRWEPVDLAGSGLELVDMVFQPDPALPAEQAGLMGGPALQVMRFVPSRNGPMRPVGLQSEPAALQFVYGRPWESTAQSTTGLSYQVIVAEPAELRAGAAASAPGPQLSRQSQPVSMRVNRQGRGRFPRHILLTTICVHPVYPTIVHRFVTRAVAEPAGPLPRRASWRR